MLVQLSDTVRTQRWTDQAIRDTIAAIADNPAYHRELSQSIWDKILRFFIDQVNRLLDVVGATAYGRIITITLVVLAAGLVLARLALGVVAERRAGSFTQRHSADVESTARLSEAEQLAAKGDFTAAAHVLFAIVLSTGNARGEFRFHPSKTSGDYAREIRRQATRWLHPFQNFRQRYDRVIYGDTVCSADEYQALLTEVYSMLGRERVA